MALETPRYNLHHFPEVYDPSEDTFLFLDALEGEKGFLEQLQPSLAVEIGSGSGVIITALFSMLKSSCYCLASDINSQACLATVNTAKMNNANLETVNMDLLSCFRNQFDVILFNPPYVITDSVEVAASAINRAFAGGRNGREVIDRILKNLPQYLSENGVCYMVLLKENNVEEVSKIVQKLNFKSEKILERKIPGEHLYIYKFSRDK